MTPWGAGWRFPLYLRIWIAVLLAVGLLTLAFGWLWRLNAEQQPAPALPREHAQRPGERGASVLERVSGDERHRELEHRAERAARLDADDRVVANLRANSNRLTSRMPLQKLQVLNYVIRTDIRTTVILFLLCLLIFMGRMTTMICRTLMCYQHSSEK